MIYDVTSTGQARIQKMMEVEEGAERTARFASAIFCNHAHSAVTEIQQFNRQECLQSPRMAPSAYTNWDVTVYVHVYLEAAE